MDILLKDEADFELVIMGWALICVIRVISGAGIAASEEPNEASRGGNMQGAGREGGGVDCCPGNRRRKGSAHAERRRWKIITDGKEKHKRMKR